MGYIEEFLESVSRKFARTDIASGREMIYRADFEVLLKHIFKADGKVTQINHDATSDNGNKPDFVITKNSTPILYIEAKDIGISLDKIEASDQMNRYFGYDNLILTDYIEFRFYRNGEKYGSPVSIANYDKGARSITPLPHNFSLLAQTLIDFAASHKEPIKRGKQLAQIMGGKAHRIRDNVREMLLFASDRHADLLKMRDVVKEHLVSNLTDDDFADMYAQTLVYGLFAARYNDPTADTFSRAEARELVPKTNPFLRSFFDHIAGTSFPERLRFIVDELCEVFTHANIEKILHDFYGKEKDEKDPIIHFYEDFLREYDSKKKMEMGVFYTPRPVVQFIVRAVDSILKDEFGLEKGLADSSKISIEKKEVNAKGKEVKVKKEYHRVQVLDVATGTGTFLNEVINHVYSGFGGQEGRWPAYVEKDLLPRLHGFELMMASYTIAHLKLGMTLRDTKAESVSSRLGVYLTNTLEAPVNYQSQGTLFGLMDSIAQESKSASRIKSEYPIMCVIGNPPYSGESMNPGYTGNDVYKFEPGGVEKLKERNSKWINDDYVKFIRFAESLIEKNEEGIVGMITAHGYIDNPTFRGMRWHLRKTFDRIYVIDLHGNSRKKEVNFDGSKDENVFDIMSGVAIILGVKFSDRNKNKELATVNVFDVYGDRETKLKNLDAAALANIAWEKLPVGCDVWKVEGEGKEEYLKGFSVNELFTVSSVGVVTGRDAVAISEDKDQLKANIVSYASNQNFEYQDEKVHKIAYRPFDVRYIYYDKKFIERGRWDVMRHFTNGENVGLIFKRGGVEEKSAPVFISGYISESRSWSRPGMQGIESLAPLYTYDEGDKKSPNLNDKIWREIDSVVGDTTPEDVLDYVYACLNSVSYREKYKEFFRTDFPRVPYPKDKKQFHLMSKIGRELREIHLFQPIKGSKLITVYPVPGSDKIDKISYKDGKVFVNSEQYFGNIPDSAWSFYIGGYQPAQKWLKDRKGRILTNEEIEHYQKIIVALVETDRIMKEIDGVI